MLDVTIEFFVVHANFLVHPDATGPLAGLVVSKLPTLRMLAPGSGSVQSLQWQALLLKMPVEKG